MSVPRATRFADQQNHPPKQTGVSTQWGPWMSQALSLISLYLPVECKHLNQWSVCVAVLSVLFIPAFEMEIVIAVWLFSLPLYFVYKAQWISGYQGTVYQISKNLLSKEKLIWKDCYKTDTLHNLYPMLIGLWYRICVYVCVLHTKV